MSPELVIALARRCYGIEVPEGRAAELAAELGRLEATARATAEGLAFDEACWSHAALVDAWLAEARNGHDD